MLWTPLMHRVYAHLCKRPGSSSLDVAYDVMKTSRGEYRASRIMDRLERAGYISADNRPTGKPPPPPDGTPSPPINSA